MGAKPTPDVIPNKQQKMDNVQHNIHTAFILNYRKIYLIVKTKNIKSLMVQIV
jgi:hypothetical protein